MRTTAAVTASVLCCLALLGLGPAPSRAQAPAAPPAAPAAAVPIRYTLADCHFHFVDFLQHTDGMDAMLAAMDRTGVRDAMISGMPLVKIWSTSEPIQPKYYLEDDGRCYWYSATDIEVARAVQSAPPAQRIRLHPFICGFNGTDRNGVEHVQRMLDWYPGLWQGIGEVMTRHDDLTALTYGETAHADSIALDPIYDLAAANDLPVSIHSDVSSVWKRDPIYLGEIESAVKRHPKTRFIWCHAGISRRIDVPTIVPQIRRLLTTYPNLWIDLSWVVYDQYLVKDGKAAPDWVALIEQFPTRFMIGSDIVGHFDSYSPTMQRYYVVLDALKPDTARRVAHDNFMSVLPQKK